VPTPTSVGRLGKLFNADSPRKLLKSFGNSKIALVNPKACEAPLVKEELHAEEDANHYFVYDMTKSRGGRYSDGSCIELPLS
jgi:hypothetical protein